MSKDYSSVVQAIVSAEASLKLARQLLGGGSTGRSFVSEGRSQERELSNLPYIDGTFDGSHMVDASGKRYEVNTNYATKSMLVFGDKLRAYDDHGRYWFKQIEKVRRDKVSGLLTQKGGIWHVVTSDGSYKVSKDAVEFLKLKVDSEVNVFVPALNKRVPFATIEFTEGRGGTGERPKKEETGREEEKKISKKELKEEKSAPKKAPKVEKKRVKKTVSAEEKEKVVLEEDDLR